MPRGSYPHILRVGSKRSSLVVALTAVLAILGSLTLAIGIASGTDTTARLTQTSSALTQQRKDVVARQRAQVVSRRLTHVVAHPPRPHSSNNQQGLPFMASGNAKLPEIALTFDDGPNPSYTPQILAILQEYGVRATFFDIGRFVAAYPHLVQREYLAGHTVANHTWTHPNLTLLSATAIQAQLAKTSATIQATIGERPEFFRPPYGLYNYQVLAQAKNLGITTVTWNVDARDWSLPGVALIVKRVLRGVRNGAVILLHDGGGDRSQTVAALPIIIRDLEQRGFRFVTLHQMSEDM